MDIPKLYIIKGVMRLKKADTKPLILFDRRRGKTYCYLCVVRKRDTINYRITKKVAAELIAAGFLHKEAAAFKGWRKSVRINYTTDEETISPEPLQVGGYEDTRGRPATFADDGD